MSAAEEERFARLLSVDSEVRKEKNAELGKDLIEKDEYESLDLYGGEKAKKK